MPWAGVAPGVGVGVADGVGVGVGLVPGTISPGSRRGEITQPETISKRTNEDALNHPHKKRCFDPNTWSIIRL